MAAGGASPRLGRRSAIAPEGRPKALPFKRHVSPFRAMIRVCRDRGSAAARLAPGCYGVTCQVN